MAVLSTTASTDGAILYCKIATSDLEASASCLVQDYLIEWCVAGQDADDQPTTSPDQCSNNIAAVDHSAILQNSHENGADCDYVREAIAGNPEPAKD